MCWSQVLEPLLWLEKASIRRSVFDVMGAVAQSGTEDNRHLPTYLNIMFLGKRIPSTLQAAGAQLL